MSVARLQANLRGGGEYGVDWRNAGSKANKQNVFNDFQVMAAAFAPQLPQLPGSRAKAGLFLGHCILTRLLSLGYRAPAVGACREASTGLPLQIYYIFEMPDVIR
jgi:prolyl oligopeptidase